MGAQMELHMDGRERVMYDANESMECRKSNGISKFVKECERKVPRVSYL